MTTKNVISAHDQFASDASLESDGAWVQLGTMGFKIARAGGDNEEFLKAASKRFKPFQAAIAADTMPKAMATEMVLDVFIDTILKDWKDVYGKDGELIPYSAENARALLTELPNLFIALQTEAQKMGNFRKENLEAAAGN